MSQRSYRIDVRHRLVDRANKLINDPSHRLRYRAIQQAVFTLRQRRAVGRQELIQAGFNPRGGS